MGFLCSRYAWQVNTNRFSILRPSYITGSVLAHSDSHPISVSLCPFSLHSDSRLQRHCLPRLVRTACLIRLEANCPWELFQIRLATNSLKKERKKKSAQKIQFSWHWTETFSAKISSQIKHEWNERWSEMNQTNQTVNPFFFPLKFD